MTDILGLWRDYGSRTITPAVQYWAVRMTTLQPLEVFESCRCHVTVLSGDTDQIIAHEPKVLELYHTFTTSQGISPPPAPLPPIVSAEETFRRTVIPFDDYNDESGTAKIGRGSFEIAFPYPSPINTVVSHWIAFSTNFGSTEDYRDWMAHVDYEVWYRSAERRGGD